MKNIFEAKFKRARVKAEAIKSLHQANETVLLDKRFCCMPSYLTLKIFKIYSKVKQSDESKYWATFCLLVPVVAPLLIKNNPGMLKSVQAIIDFVYMAEYKLHSNQTLCYMQYALYQINQTKEVFRNTQQNGILYLITPIR